MAGRKELSVVCYLIIDCQTIPVDELTEEQRRRWKESACRRSAERMSDYYTQHPDEYKKLLEK